nr:MAG TPA: distal tail protein [Caudoviricetes sp.]
MEPYFIFRGIDSRDIGVIIEDMFDVHRPKRNVQTIQVPGRDGRLTQDDGTYDTYTISGKVNCFGVPLSDVYAWLSGSGDLILGDEPTRSIRASATAQIKNTRFRCDGCYDSLQVSFDCQPFRYHVEQAESANDIILTSSSATITNPGTYASAPRLTIEGTGTAVLTIGTQIVEIDGLEDGIIIDSELGDCFDLTETQLKNSVVTLMDDAFPTLAPGANIISWTGNVTKITITPRWRDL